MSDPLSDLRATISAKSDQALAACLADEEMVDHWTRWGEGAAGIHDALVARGMSPQEAGATLAGSLFTILHILGGGRVDG